jgi:hypothetical protein
MSRELAAKAVRIDWRVPHFRPFDCLELLIPLFYLLPFGCVTRRQPPVAHFVDVAEVVQEQSGHHNGAVARLERTQYERYAQLHGHPDHEGEDPTPYLASTLVKAVLNDGKQKRADESELSTPPECSLTTMTTRAAQCFEY